MKHSKLVACGLLISMGTAFSVGILQPYNIDNWQILTGLGIMTFGIWASIILLKVK
jgi:hypothetical protein